MSKSCISDKVQTALSKNQVIRDPNIIFLHLSAPPIHSIMFNRKHLLLYNFYLSLLPFLFSSPRISSERICRVRSTNTILTNNLRKTGLQFSIEKEKKQISGI